MEGSLGDAVSNVLGAIPAGRVATYGDVARAAGREGAARAVGAVLRGLPDGTELPWWRVVGRGGRLTLPDLHGERRLQRALLEDEGVRFDARGRVRLEAFRWEAPGGAPWTPD